MAPRPVSSPTGPLPKAALPQNPGRAAESRIIAPKADFIIFARVAQRRVKCLLANDIHNIKRSSVAPCASRTAVAAQRQRAAMASRPACSSAPFASELTPSQLIYARTAIALRSRGGTRVPSYRYSYLHFRTIVQHHNALRSSSPTQHKSGKAAAHSALSPRDAIIDLSRATPKRH